jgi:hypothetical protein
LRIADPRRFSALVAKILGDHSTERLTIEENDRTTGSTQPARQFMPQGSLAGAG